jgi:hypothetical protein
VVSGLFGQLIGLVVAAALPRFTISMRDHRRALEAAQQAGRPTMTTPPEVGVPYGTCPFVVARPDLLAPALSSLRYPRRAASSG